MGNPRARYTLEFKLEAVRMVKGGQSLAAVAKILDIRPQTLHNWIKAEQQGRLGGAGSPAVSAEQMEIARLKAELARVSQTPSACQSRKRRQHVIPLPKPSSLGRSSHGIPVCKTNRMPFNAARSSTRGRPPLVEGSTTGNSGCSAFHNSLLIFFRAMSPTTLKAHGSMTWFC